METDGTVWLQGLLAVAALSCVSLVGGATLVLRPDVLRRGLVILIPFAAGALLGDSFFHLIPEIAESEKGLDFFASSFLLAGIVAFFVLEKVLHWHHAHFPHEEVIHPVAVSNLLGDGLHNLVDGAIVAGAFVAGPELGIATAIAVALHEIPQELGDFAILHHAGVEPKRALRLNFFSGLLALAGAVLALSFSSVETIERGLLPFSAGAFVYIAGTDLIPELHKEPEGGKSLAQVAALVAGLVVMAALLVLE